MPVEPAAPSGIAFATNVTPITFNEPMTDKEDMFLSAEDPSSPRRAAHSKKKPDNHIPRPPNAFILFRRKCVEDRVQAQEAEAAATAEAVKAEGNAPAKAKKARQADLSKLISQQWRSLSGMV